MCRTFGPPPYTYLHMTHIDNHRRCNISSHSHLQGSILYLIFNETELAVGDSRLTFLVAQRDTTHAQSKEVHASLFEHGGRVVAGQLVWRRRALGTNGSFLWFVEGVCSM